MRNYFDLGPQNSRGFRTLKVWLGLRQAGRPGYLRMMADDILLAHQLRQIVAEHPELEAFTHNLSITTFRYAPSDLRSDPGSAGLEEYLNRLNRSYWAASKPAG